MDRNFSIAGVSKKDYTEALDRLFEKEKSTLFIYNMLAIVATSIASVVFTRLYAHKIGFSLDTAQQIGAAFLCFIFCTLVIVAPLHLVMSPLKKKERGILIWRYAPRYCRMNSKALAEWRKEKFDGSEDCGYIDGLLRYKEFCVDKYYCPKIGDFLLDVLVASLYYVDVVVIVLSVAFASVDIIQGFGAFSIDLSVSLVFSILHFFVAYRYRSRILWDDYVHSLDQVRMGDN